MDMDTIRMHIILMVPLEDTTLTEEPMEEAMEAMVEAMVYIDAEFVEKSNVQPKQQIKSKSFTCEENLLINYFILFIISYHFK